MLRVAQHEHCCGLASPVHCVASMLPWHALQVLLGLRTEHSMAVAVCQCT